MLLIVAFSAILIPLLLIVLLRMPARRAMTIAALAVALLSSVVWEMDNLALSASALQGIHRATTILWIVFGAILFLSVMQTSGAVERIKHGFMKISPDMRIQTIIIAFALVAMLEGIAGFGTPAAIAVPLLLALGFRPMVAVVLALVGDSVPTSFGAMATPLYVGLSNVPTADVKAVGGHLTVIDSLFGLLLPTFLAIILIVWFGRKSERIRDVTEILPWTLFVGLVYVVTALLSVRFIGLEFTSIVSGAVALAFALVTANYNILTPKTIWRHHADEKDREVIYHEQTTSLVKAWLPYGLIIIILLLQRAYEPMREVMNSFLDLSWDSILGISQINSGWAFLMSPGTVLCIVALITSLMYRQKILTLGTDVMRASKTVGITAMALLPTLIMVQIFVNSGLNDSGLVSMPNYIAHTFAMYLAPVWVIVSPIIGTLTAFIMGSSTVSTLTMSPVQVSVASELGVPIDIAMAQQISGANAGNIIAIHNVVAASAVAGLHHQEYRIIRHTLPMAVVYLLCSIAVATIILHWA